MIKIENLSKRFGELTVFEGLDAEIHKGEVVSIIGPSGTGKSTLLRCFNLLERPSGGSIRIDGADVLAPGFDVARLRQKMNMVFQSFNLFAHLPVLDNLTLAPIKLKGADRTRAEEKARELLSLVGLTEKAESFPDELSGGQKQRVAIARCLAMEPEIILFDEPTSALDPTMISEVLSVIRRLAKEGLTMAIVTHELDFARDVSNRVFYMDEGSIYEEGEARQIFDQPRRTKTRAFIRRIRSYDCRIESPDFDIYALHGRIESFCEKHFLTRKGTHDLMLLAEELLQIHTPYLRRGGGLALTIDYSEATGRLQLTLELDEDVGNLLDSDDEDGAMAILIIRGLAETIDYRLVDSRSRLDLVVKH